MGEWFSPSFFSKGDDCMFIKSVRKWHTRNGQRASGAFLMLFCREGRELRACVRHVKLTQTSYFMMTRIKLGPWNFVVYGDFGGEGLPIDLRINTMTPKEVEQFWEQLVPIPQKLAKRYWKSDGGNRIPNSIANDFRKWALTNLKVLRKPIKGSAHQDLE
jgi:hypothetical protein